MTGFTVKDTLVEVEISHISLGFVIDKRSEASKRCVAYLCNNYAVAPKHLIRVIIPKVPGTRRDWRTHICLEQDRYPVEAINLLKDIVRAFAAGVDAR